MKWFDLYNIFLIVSLLYTTVVLASDGIYKFSWKKFIDFYIYGYILNYIFIIN